LIRGARDGDINRARDPIPGFVLFWASSFDSAPADLKIQQVEGERALRSG
jgi:hypothetical protein